ncbi:MAG TPA: trehalose-phosphatase [Azonexus sp.]|nr:trehalose-phosphatase [Azonexus sp.]
MARETPGRPPVAESGWAYFLDFDGTLLELAATPDTIRVDSALPVLLGNLQQACAGAVALISGRALADLDLRLGMPHLAKAGQHGLERRDAAGRVWLHASPPQARQTIRAALAPLLRRHRGLLLEDKGMSLALHYRRAPELASHVHQLMRRLVAEIDEDLVIQEGKCVVEVKPTGIDKGTAICEYLAEAPFRGRRPVFIGDDKTDEHAFEVVNEHDGISIGVGSASVNALYRLPNVIAVRRWLAAAVDKQH